MSSGIRDVRPAPAQGAPAARARPGLLERFLLNRVAERMLPVQLAAVQVAASAGDVTSVARRFLATWLLMIRPALGHGFRYVLHLGAIGTALGAVLGMYVRGLFFAYHVVWRSTFVNDPEIVGTALGLLLAPAALLLGRSVPGTADALALMSREGSPAAPWIHMFAATIILTVVIPRTALAIASAQAFRRAADRAELDLADSYYRELLDKASRLDAPEVRTAIRADVDQECRRFADEVAGFVVLELYDRRIVPQIDTFRDRGGRLADLELRMHEHCRAFGPTLQAGVARARHRLEVRLTEQIAWRLGDTGAGRAVEGSEVLEVIGGASLGAAGHVGNTVGSRIHSGIATAVTAAVAGVAGTVSGGFGSVLGTALLVGVVHSGPVAWLIGVLAGAVTAVAALYLGRDALRQGVKRVPLPKLVVRAALWRVQELKAQGRAQCERSVREALAAQLEGASARIADAIWARVEPLIGPHTTKQNSPTRVTDSQPYDRWPSTQQSLNCEVLVLDDDDGCIARRVAADCIVWSARETAVCHVLGQPRCWSSPPARTITRSCGAPDCVSWSTHNCRLRWRGCSRRWASDVGVFEVGVVPENFLARRACLPPRDPVHPSRGP